MEPGSESEPPSEVPELISPVPGSEAGFGMESYLHEFLVENWASTELGRDWGLIEEDGEIIGSHYNTEVGEIDLLAKHRTEKRWLVIELKRGRSNDSALGQLLRYMGWVRKNLAEDGVVEGMIIAREIDRRLRYAMDGLRDVRCMTYEVSFSLRPAPGL